MKVTMSSICGSDMHPYAGRGVALDHGITFGHEYTGVVVAVGDDVSLCRHFDSSSVLPDMTVDDLLAYIGMLIIL